MSTIILANLKEVEVEEVEDVPLGVVLPVEVLLEQPPTTEIPEVTAVHIQCFTCITNQLITTTPLDIGLLNTRRFTTTVTDLTFTMESTGIINKVSIAKKSLNIVYGGVEI
jgi:hypothetical protein